jgi:2',3'-cyclic-nucleotide 2'-phosphodiesterase (5'-nucleotidase family)
VNLRPNTPLGNWLVDSIRSFTKADVALQKAWGIQHNLGPGPIRESDIDEMIAYDEELWVVGLRGEDLKAVFEYGFEKSYNNLAFSGATLTVDYRKPQQERVVKVTIGGRKLDPNRVYTVATSEFLAGGNTGFRWMRNAVEPTALGMRLREFIVDRLKEQGSLKGVKTGRLTEIGTQTD